MFQPITLLLEGDEAELPPCCGHSDLLTTLDDTLGAQAVGDEVLDGDDLESKALSYFPELR